MRFTLKERPMVRADLDDFVACYASGERRKRKETERFRRFTYADLIARGLIGRRQGRLRRRCAVNP
jgi:type I restriction enzyme M protein